MYAQDALRQLGLMMVAPVDELLLLPLHAGYMAHPVVLGRTRDPAAFSGCRRFAWARRVRGRQHVAPWSMDW